jgi:multidrug efflux pump
MNISAPFIRRPVGTSLLTLGVLLVGALAFGFLPVAPLPQVEYPVISVSAKLPGASPETMASAVATPLERQFGRIAGINQMTSSSRLGGTNINIQFDLDKDIDAAAREVQAAINGARGQLPADMPSNPTYKKSNPADQAILSFGLSSDLLTRPRIYDAADSILAQKISQIEGVGDVNIVGGAKPAVRVEVNPGQLSKLGIGTDQIRTALNAANANRPKGLLANATTAWMITDNDQLFKAEQYRSLIVSSGKGSTVRLQDVADVSEGTENVLLLGIANGRPALTMSISRQPGANIIGTVDRIMALMPALKASIPPSINIDLLQDRTTTVRASVHDIERTLVISVLLVVLVVFVFLRNVRATVIPSVAVPISLIGTFGVMYLLNYSIDNLSLMALAISTGFVVDDAIVVLENITRYVEMGLRPIQAALKGAREIGFTVLTMSTSLIGVFIPLLLMSGIVGRLFREFAVTMSIAIGISLLVSLSTTPMMCAQLLKARDEQRHGGVYRFSERIFQGVLRAYTVCLRWVLRHQPVVLMLTIATAGLSVYLYLIVPKGFFPQQDTGRINGSLQAQQDISFQAMLAKMKPFYDIVTADPAVATVSGTVGGTNGTVNNGNFNITLKPWGQRDVTSDQVINRLRGKLTAVPGARLVLNLSQELQIGGRGSASQYQYTLQSESMDDLNRWAPRVQEVMSRLPEVRDVATDQQSHGLEASVVIDRDTASRLGVKMQTIDDALYDAFGQRQVSTSYGPLNQYHVVLAASSMFNHDPDAFHNIYVRSSTGNEVPLSAFTRYEPSNSALVVNHQGQFPALTLSFNLAPNVSLGQATQAIEEATRKMGLPATIYPSFQGAAAVFKQSVNSEPLLILAALVAVYIVLGVLYESYIHPITILSTLPSAGVGALLALLLTHHELDIIALIGIILLIGLVKKNAIMMIDFALDAERREGKPPAEAILQACLLRFRPIMMTTMAAMLGGLPLALGTGTGSELRRPLGITIVGGLIVSQMLTLFTTPVVYLYMDRLVFWKKHARGGEFELRSPLSPDSTAAH